MPEIKPVKPLSFVPEKSSVKTLNHNPDYSDVVDTNDDIAEGQSQINTMNQEAVSGRHLWNLLRKNICS